MDPRKCESGICSVRGAAKAQALLEGSWQLDFYILMSFSAQPLVDSKEATPRVADLLRSRNLFAKFCGLGSARFATAQRAAAAAGALPCTCGRADLQTMLLRFCAASVGSFCWACPISAATNDRTKTLQVP